MIIFHTIFLLMTVATVTLEAYSQKKKGGTCPKETHAELAVCKEECSNDHDCPGNELCCRLSACSTYCRSPVGRQGGTHTTLVLTEAGSKSRASGIGSSLGINDKLIAHASAGSGATGRGQSVSGIIRSSSSGMSSVVSLDDDNCNHVCGQGKSCPLGHKCVLEGCRSYCLESSAGSSLSDTLRRGSSVSEIIRSSSSGMSSGIRDGSRQGSNCDYVCGGEKPCQSGYKCIHEGCNSYCVKSSGSIIGIPKLSETISGRNTNSEVIRSSSSGHGMSRVSSSSGASSIKCVNECGGDVSCGSGHKCVHEGCSRYCVKISSGGMLGSSGVLDSISGGHTMSKIVKNSLSGMSRSSSGIGGSSSKCVYGCGDDKRCELGYKCVHEGCDSYCVKMSSGGMIGSSGLLDSISGGHTVSEIVRGSQSGMSSVSSGVGGSSSKCLKECGGDIPCRSGYKCVQEGCSRYCVKKSSGGMIGSSGLLDSISGGHTVTEIVRSSHSGMSRSSSRVDGSSSKCAYGCGDDKRCESGYKCVHEGCDSYCIKMSSGGVIGSSGLLDSISGRNTMSEIVRNLKSGMSSVSSGVGRSSTKCTNECGKDVSCGSGYACVQEGCSSYCARRSSGGILGRSGHSSTSSLALSGTSVGSSRSSAGHRTGSDILDSISLGGSGTGIMDTSSTRRSGSVGSSGSRIVSHSANEGSADCRKLCHTNEECPTNKECVTVNCHRFCRRSRLSKGYTR
ncbi:hornerin-like [Mytilus californianus]|uniref:hornerin-like n=1 Tax=Mytilus californianus TaxID=6549 RepID=UPI002247079E|nr:hornerin-like [Mytilus californianus]